MRGRKSKYYDYTKAESLDDLNRMNGCDIMVYRPWLKPMFEGDLLVVFPEDKWWIDKDADDEKNLMFPDIEYVNKLKTYMLKDMRNAVRWVSKFVDTFSDNDKVKDAFNKILESYERALKKQKEMDGAHKQRYSWYVNHKPNLLPEQIITAETDEDKKESLEYTKMVAREYRQLNWVMMMQEVFIPKFRIIMDLVLEEAIEAGRENETIRFRIDEYNRLKKQTRQEQERKIK